MTDDAKTRLLTLTREGAKRAGGIETEHGRALDLLADKFESLVTNRDDADRLLHEALFSDATWPRVQEVRRQLTRNGQPQSEVEKNLQCHAVLWVRQRLVSEEDRQAYDNTIKKIARDFRGGSAP